MPRRESLATLASDIRVFAQPGPEAANERRAEHVRSARVDQISNLFRCRERAVELDRRNS